MKQNDYGARIERGEIVSAEKQLYQVKSITRDGIITPPIGAMGQAAYAVGDLVYFFLFDDGNGKIIAGLK